MSTEQKNRCRPPVHRCSQKAEQTWQSSVVQSKRFWRPYHKIPKERSRCSPSRERPARTLSVFRFGTKQKGSRFFRLPELVQDGSFNTPSRRCRSRFPPPAEKTRPKPMALTGFCFICPRQTSPAWRCKAQCQAGLLCRRKNCYAFLASPAGKMILLTKKKITIETPPLSTVVPML